MKAKKVFFNIHSWIGIRLSILFFIVCFSGTLATLSHEMDWLFNPNIRAVPQEHLASRNTMVSNFRALYPKSKITYWVRHDEPYLCDIIYREENGKRSYVFANPYTGKIQGESNLTIQRYFRDLHYFLFIPFYQIGYLIVLTFAFLLLISLVTALFFYKKWWRKLFELQTGKGSLVFFRSLHRLVGLWSVPFTLLFSVTGIWYFLERTNVADIRTTANPLIPKVVPPEGNDNATKLDLSQTVDYDMAIALAKREIPQLSVGSITPPRKPNESIYLTGHSDVPLVRQRANRVYVNPYTYQVIGVQRAEHEGTVMWLNDIADPLHFGYWGGLATKILWFLMGMGICSLILTGIWISLKRQALKRKKVKKKIMGVWRYINWILVSLVICFMGHTLSQQYDVSFQTMTIIGLAWSIFLLLAYYIFVYQLNKVVNR
ncbi:Uncharacterized iron-regulated membrane protein [Flagellimonas taeanensis]|uniref:Uncharacterized iron-regulated membrane protein n=1 Tax=Flagellimonas taeanensis TaxID=1005926 RepID=A0A1M6UUG7_9FLAO|nr:PepSY-associated TM helix domain-containing protein [Allomuricauda taeanensis]SFC23434.1 Uncharacterized iron-regulated membrane protein [Allomuricauda taeanensis]SHK72814.1 Uncharacterized iron-regulated membrane protein [Allomuricauda taeanensis]